MSHYYIMSASCLFNNKASTIDGIAKEWGGESTVLVAERETGYDKTSRLFIVGSGVGYEGPIDSRCPVRTRYTQDTGNGYSNKNKCLTIVNTITVTDGLITDEGNGFGVNEKRRVWVMK
jgi:hypothetical protein